MGDRTRVNDDSVDVVRVLGDYAACVRKLAGDPVAVGLIQLAAERENGNVAQRLR
jgi:hypothetical protein